LKLLTRSTYYYFVFSILVLFFAGVGLYYTIRSIVYRQIDESLITEKTIIQDQIEETDTIPDFSASFGHQIEVQLLPYRLRYSQSIRDTDIFDSGTEKFLAFRHIRFTGSTPKYTGYVINIYQLNNESSSLLDSIGLGMFFLLVALFLILIALNYLISRNIWKPFYKTLSEARSFDVLDNNRLDLPDTNIDEFRQMNDVLEEMTRKIKKDYVHLKEYNENLSHEIQTPLAVIRSKLDILIQNRKLNKESINLIKSINEASIRLFRLNQALLLMSRIENLQFAETRKISLRELVEKILMNYEEIMQLKKIKVETEFADKAMVNMNEDLADVMISNLLGNAIRHNIDGGFIRCRLDDRSLTITNSGLPLKAHPEKLFNRFQKGSDHPDGIGLGLSIVKNIADHYRMGISFSSSGTVHEIKLDYGDDAFRLI
jgi:signal transduction histidine kinase